MDEIKKKAVSPPQSTQQAGELSGNIFATEDFSHLKKTFKRYMFQLRYKIKT